jgi:Nucleotidyl transferase of unknown function (DUF2204)
MKGVQPKSDVADPEWEQIPEAQWAVYREVIRQARAEGVRFAFGGAFATAAYTGALRNTKDFDFYILPADREAMQRTLIKAGLTDYFDQAPYDRSWIYRGSRGDIIVDAIWAMANHRADVDRQWLELGKEVVIRGERLRAIPVEELIWSKLYVLQRERCDWPDVLNLLDAQAGSIDWERLVDRLGEDTSLLAGATSVFAWLASDRARIVPSRAWQRLELQPPVEPAAPDLVQSRANLLDSRPWFTRLLR